jgi:Meiotically up-regulated gene 113
MEMRLRKRSDSNFPNEKVYDRFGNRNELRARLIAHCESQPEFADVIAICVKTVSAKKLPTAAKKSVVEDGFVYLLKSGRFYKIGRSNAAGRRERELDIQLPEKATNLHVIRTDDPVGIEAYWHRRFASRRVRPDAEWFSLSADEIAAFRRRKFM